MLRRGAVLVARRPAVRRWFAAGQTQGMGAWVVPTGVVGVAVASAAALEFSLRQPSKVPTFVAESDVLRLYASTTGRTVDDTSHEADAAATTKVSASEENATSKQPEVSSTSAPAPEKQNSSTPSSSPPSSSTPPSSSPPPPSSTPPSSTPPSSSTPSSTTTTTTTKSEEETPSSSFLREDDDDDDEEDEEDEEDEDVGRDYLSSPPAVLDVPETPTPSASSLPSPSSLEEELAVLEAEELTRPAQEASRARECRREGIELSRARTEAALDSQVRAWARREAADLAEVESAIAAERTKVLRDVDDEFAARRQEERQRLRDRLEKEAVAAYERAAAKLTLEADAATVTAFAEAAKNAGDDALAIARRLRALEVRVQAAKQAAADAPADDAAAVAAHAEIALDVSEASHHSSDALLALRNRWTASVFPNALAASKRPLVDKDAPLLDAAVGSLVAKVELDTPAWLASPFSSAASRGPPTDEVLRDDVLLRHVDAAVKDRDLETALDCLGRVRDDKVNVLVSDWRTAATALAIAQRDAQRKDARALLLAASRAEVALP